MVKVGFIDYFLDEWHANSYPDMFKKWASDVRVTCAWAKIDSPKGGLTTKQWSEKYGIEVKDTLEEVIAESDVLVVLSPDNPEMHEELCCLPLASGKPTYVDKTFAENTEIALRIMEMAKASATPWYTTSALYFAEEYKPFYEKEVVYLDSQGPGYFGNYSIHQLEPAIALIKAEPVRAIALKSEPFPVVAIEFEGGKLVKCANFPEDGSFMMTIGTADGKSKCVTVASDFWKGFIEALAKFFTEGIVPVPHKNTLRVMKARELAVKALKAPGTWVE